MRENPPKLEVEFGDWVEQAYRSKSRLEDEVIQSIVESGILERKMRRPIQSSDIAVKRESELSDG